MKTLDSCTVGAQSNSPMTRFVNGVFLALYRYDEAYDSNRMVKGYPELNWSRIVSGCRGPIRTEFTFTIRTVSQRTDLLRCAAIAECGLTRVMQTPTLHWVLAAAG